MTEMTFCVNSPFKTDAPEVCRISCRGRYLPACYFRFSAGIRGEDGESLMMARPPATSHLCLKGHIRDHSLPVIPL